MFRKLILMRVLRHVCQKLGGGDRRSHNFVQIRPGRKKWSEIASVNGDQGHRIIRINVLIHPEFADSRLAVNCLRMAMGGAIRVPRRT